MQHVFTELPKFGIGFQPALLKVRCPGWHGKLCGRPHLEYFGPKDRDEKKLELRFLRHELTVAIRIIKKFSRVHKGSKNYLAKTN